MLYDPYKFSKDNIVDIDDKADLSVIADAFDPAVSYVVGDFTTYNNKLYKCTTAHTGAWVAADFAETKVSNEFGSGGGGADLSVIAAEFSTSTSYAVGDYVTYNGAFYRCTTAHSAGAWNASHFTETTVDVELDLKVSKSGDTMTGALNVESNITADGEITDGGGNVLSDKYDATSLTFPNERFTISASGWSSTQTSGYYTYTLSTGNTKYNTYCPVFMDKTGVNDSTDPTSAEEAAYDLVDKFDMADGTGVNSFTLYAKTKPTTTFYIKLSGQYMAKNAASSSKALDIETANALSFKDYMKVGSWTNTNTPIAFNGGAAHELCWVNEVVLIDASAWSSTVDANGYYYLTAGLSKALYTYVRPDVICGGSPTNLDERPTAEQGAAYNLVDHFHMNTSSSESTIFAYAKTKPTTNFYITVSGLSIS